jgi:hypothetical protein
MKQTRRASNGERAVRTLQEAPPATGRILSASEIMDRSQALTEAAERRNTAGANNAAAPTDSQLLDVFDRLCASTGVPHGAGEQFRDALKVYAQGGTPFSDVREFLRAAKGIHDQEVRRQSRAEHASSVNVTMGAEPTGIDALP